MLRENRKTLIVTSLVTILPILIGLILWKDLPDVMATHFGLDNEANGFSSKPLAVFGIPLFCLAIQWILALVTAGDPRRKNVSPKVLAMCLWIVPAVSLFCGGMIYPYNLGLRMDITRISGILTGLLFVIVGNYLPKTRRNYTIGIRVPWTLASEENWNRTHRLGGFLWVVGGMALLLLTFVGFLRAELLIGMILIVALVPCIYSFWLYTKGLK